MMLGFDRERDERELANAWFQSIEEPEERRRIADLFAMILLARGEQPPLPWNPGEGGLPLPLPALAAHS